VYKYTRNLCQKQAEVKKSNKIISFLLTVHIILNFATHNFIHLSHTMIQYDREFNFSYLQSNETSLVYEPSTSYSKDTEYIGSSINNAIKDYYEVFTNKEKNAILKWIISQPQFNEMRRFSTNRNKLFALNIFQYDKILEDGEMPQNLDIAKKILANGYDVFMLSNPCFTKSADFIIQKRNKLLYIEGKTTTGNSSLVHCFEAGIKQSDRIILNAIDNCNTKHFSAEIKRAFQKYENLKEIFLLKNSRLLIVTKQIALSKNFDYQFKKLWNLSK